MKTEDFLEIYKHSMAKLLFKRVKLTKSDKNGTGRLYYHFIGEFEFVPPESILSMKDPNANKDSVLKGLKAIDKDDLSLIYRKKFTRKITYKKTKKIKWKFDYIFDFKPFNIVDYNVDKKTGRMIIEVMGYGMF